MWGAGGCDGGGGHRIGAAGGVPGCYGLLRGAERVAARRTYAPSGRGLGPPPHPGRRPRGASVGDGSGRGAWRPSTGARPPRLAYLVRGTTAGRGARGARGWVGWAGRSERRSFAGRRPVPRALTRGRWSQLGYAITGVVCDRALVWRAGDRQSPRRSPCRPVTHPGGRRVRPSPTQAVALSTRHPPRRSPCPPVTHPGGRLVHPMLTQTAINGGRARSARRERRCLCTCHRSSRSMTSAQDPTQNERARERSEPPSAAQVSGYAGRACARHGRRTGGGSPPRAHWRESDVKGNCTRKPHRATGAVDESARRCGMEARSEPRHRTRVNPCAGRSTRVNERLSAMPEIQSGWSGSGGGGRGKSCALTRGDLPGSATSGRPVGDDGTTSGEKSDRLIVALKPGNAGGAKGATR